MRRQVLVFSLAIALLVLLLADCSSLLIKGHLLDSDLKKSQVADNTNESKIRLTVLHNFSGTDLRSKTMRALIDEFRKAHPEISLNVQVMPNDGYKPRIKTLAAANEMPDVFIMWPGIMTRDLANADLIQPIDGLLDSHPAWKHNFLPGSFDDFTFDHQIYAAPTGLSPTSFLFYNRKIFDKFGLRAPKTWTDLIHIINVLRQNDVIPIALGDKAGWPAQSSILSEIGDRITGTRWFMDAANQRGGAKFTDPPFLSALAHMQQLADVAAFQTGYTSIDNTQAEFLFASGKAAMTIDGGWALPQFCAAASPDMLKNLDVTIMPAIPGGRGDPAAMSGVVATGFGLSKKLTGAKMKAAYALIYALSGPEAQQRIVNSNQLVSYNIDPDPHKVNSIFIKSQRLVKKVHFTPVYDDVLSSKTIDVMDRGIQQIMMDENVTGIADAIQAAQVQAMNESHE